MLLSTIRVRVWRMFESIRHITHASSGRTTTGRTTTGRTTTGRTATGRTATGRTATGRTATGLTEKSRAESSPSAALPFVRLGSTDLMCLEVVEPAAVGPCIVCFDDVEKGSLAMLDCDCQYVAHEECIGLWEQTHPQNGCIVCRKPRHVLTDYHTSEQWERIKNRLRSLATLSVVSLVFYIAIAVHDAYQ